MSGRPRQANAYRDLLFVDEAARGGCIAAECAVAGNLFRSSRPPAMIGFAQGVEGHCSCARPSGGAGHYPNLLASR